MRTTIQQGKELTIDVEHADLAVRTLRQSCESPVGSSGFSVAQLRLLARLLHRLGEPYMAAQNSDGGFGMCGTSARNRNKSAAEGASLRCPGEP
jgi:hypothetical protein